MYNFETIVLLEIFHDLTFSKLLKGKYNIASIQLLNKPYATKQKNPNLYQEREVVKKLFIINVLSIMYCLYQ